MFNIDYKNLRLKNINIYKKKPPITLNITSDWSPIIKETSSAMMNKQKFFYGGLIKYFKNSDLNITNLETVIDTQFRKSKKNGIRFINKPEVLSSLKSINTHLVCLANNHIMDNGSIGLKKTINYLKKYNMNHVGAGFLKEKIYKPFLFKKNNQKIAVINTAEGEEANERYNHHVGASDIESYRVIDQIRDCKRQGYLTILIAHAGVEYIPTPPPYIRSLYKNFVDEGVDLVVGHHPHVLQGFEIYKKVPIFYSLGNFTMWKKNLRKNCYHSYFLNIEIQKNKLLNINLIPFKINKDYLNLIPNSDCSKKIIKLNKLLLKNKSIWAEYLYRIKFETNLFFLYSFNKYKFRQINHHTNLSQKYIHLDSFRNNNISNPKYKHILDNWQIKNNKVYFLFLKNILNPLYNVFKTIKKFSW